MSRRARLEEPGFFHVKSFLSGKKFLKTSKKLKLHSSLDCSTQKDSQKSQVYPYWDHRWQLIRTFCGHIQFLEIRGYHCCHY